MITINPIRIYGLWTEGWVLDYDIIHVIPVMDDLNRPQHLRIIRSELSEALQQAGQALKFPVKSEEIINTVVHFIRDKGNDWNLDCIVPMPAQSESFHEHKLSYLLAQQLSKALNVQFLDVIEPIQRALGKWISGKADDSKQNQHEFDFATDLKGKNVLIFERHYKQCSLLNKVCGLFFNQGNAKHVYVIALIMDKPRGK